jgi:hypothetical protein
MWAHVESHEGGIKEIAHGEMILVPREAAVPRTQWDGRRPARARVRARNGRARDGNWSEGRRGLVGGIPHCRASAVRGAIAKFTSRASIDFIDDDPSSVGDTTPGE